MGKQHSASQQAIDMSSAQLARELAKKSGERSPDTQICTRQVAQPNEGQGGCFPTSAAARRNGHQSRSIPVCVGGPKETITRQERPSSRRPQISRVKGTVSRNVIHFSARLSRDYWRAVLDRRHAGTGPGRPQGVEEWEAAPPSPGPPRFVERALGPRARTVCERRSDSTTRIHFSLVYLSSSARASPRDGRLLA